jgi:hypothetical protein
MRLLIILAMTTVMAADRVPEWVCAGILAVETRSHYYEDGSIKYVDKRIGSNGEVSPFQITYRAYKQVRRSGDSWARVRIDTLYAEQIACRYLMYCYKRAGNWGLAIEYYNAGPGHRSQEYRNAIMQAARKQGYEINQ